MNQSNDRPEYLAGVTYKIKAPNGRDEMINIYVTINELANKPFEVFINCSDSSLYEFLATSMVLISKLLRKGTPPGEIISDLKHVHSANTGHMIPGGGGFCPSLAARIGHVLETHIMKNKSSQIAESEEKTTQNIKFGLSCWANKIRLTNSCTAWVYEGVNINTPPSSTSVELPTFVLNQEKLKMVALNTSICNKVVEIIRWPLSRQTIMISKIPKIDLFLLLCALYYIETQKQISLEDLCNQTGLSDSSVKRMIRTARELLGVNIYNQRHEHGYGGYYQIDDWGIFDNKKKFLRHVEKLINDQ